MVREMVILACTECKRKNYITSKNKTRATGRLELKKYCKIERRRTLHKEAK